MFIIYDLVFFFISVFYLPVYLLRRKFHRGFLSRLGILPGDLKLDRPIWIHAVSVGEAMAVRGLLRELKKEFKQKDFVISTVTATGNKIARGMAEDKDLVTYLPLDFSFVVNRVINKIKPGLFIIAETEIWPNLISCLYKQNIPIALVNGRISDSSFRGYLSIKFLLRPVLNKITVFCVQTECCALRLERLGVLKDKIHITGNMKFDVEDYAECSYSSSGPSASRSDTAFMSHSTRDTDLRKKLGLGFQGKLWAAGSTHPGEEEIILHTHKQLIADFQDLKLLIAPRHPERASDIENIILKFGFKPCRISQLDEQTNRRTGEQEVFILDTIGQLMPHYAVADIVFVGGSLVAKGGHNILEPVSLDKPVLFGPHMFNFRDIAELFFSNQGAILVHNQRELTGKIKFLLNNPFAREAMVKRARQLLLQNQGATQKNLEYIRGLIRARGR